MAKARFTEDFNFTPKEMNGRISKRYRANVDYTDCTRECVKQAQAKGILADGTGVKKVQSSDETNSEESKTSGSSANR